MTIENEQLAREVVRTLTGREIEFLPTKDELALQNIAYLQAQIGVTKRLGSTASIIGKRGYSSRITMLEQELLEALSEIDCNYYIYFRSIMRPEALVVARRVVNTLPSGVSLIRGEQFSKTGDVYIVVSGKGKDIQLLMSFTTEEVTLDIQQMALQSIQPCLNCGNIADQECTICTFCDFCVIEACPKCKTELPLSGYYQLEHNHYICSKCNGYVIITSNDLQINEEGELAAPLFHVRLDSLRHPVPDVST